MLDRNSSKIREVQSNSQIFVLSPGEMAIKIYDLEKRVEALEKENTFLSLLGRRGGSIWRSV